MDLGHHVYRLLLGGELYLAPIKESPHRVLDLGTGTGIWAMDFAELVPLPPPPARHVTQSTNFPLVETVTHHAEYH